MKKVFMLAQTLLKNEGFLYLLFGGLTTLVYMGTRLLAGLSLPAQSAATIANIAAILFAFVTNDTIVFRQTRRGWLFRFGKFILARLATMLLDVLLAYLLVERFPNVIGQFVHHNLQAVNLIEMIFSQVLIILLNYIFSKLFIFKNKKD